MAERVWSERELVRRANRRLVVLRHVEEVSGNVAARGRHTDQPQHLLPLETPLQIRKARSEFLDYLAFAVETIQTGNGASAPVRVPLARA